jgi:uncharacterized protein (DUF1800 family)
LVDCLGDAVKTTLFGDSFDTWKTSIKQARNDLAHQGGTARFTPTQLSVLYDGMRSILELTVMQELGATEDKLAELADERNVHLADRIARSFPKDQPPVEE